MAVNKRIKLRFDKEGKFADPLILYDNDKTLTQLIPLYYTRMEIYLPTSL